jgi:quinol monooxygenase YgiN
MQSEPDSIARPALLKNAALFLVGMTAAAFVPQPAEAAMADAMARKGGITVLATVKAKPGSEQMLHDVFLSLVAPARADAGNISYDLVVSSDDPATFVSVEQWKSPDALAAHLKTAPVTSAIAKLGTIVAGPPVILSYKMVSDPA